VEKKRFIFGKPEEEEMWGIARHDIDINIRLQLWTGLL